MVTQSPDSAKITGPEHGFIEGEAITGIKGSDSYWGRAHAQERKHGNYLPAHRIHRHKPVFKEAPREQRTIVYAATVPNTVVLVCDNM